MNKTWMEFLDMDEMQLASHLWSANAGWSMDQIANFNRAQLVERCIIASPEFQTQMRNIEKEIIASINK